jgi:hypothetical protein
MNVAPTTRDPRAARRTSCLGTFLLVLVLWSLSVVALAAYLVTRSTIVRQVRVAWWTVFLAAAALLAVEVAVFEATGDGLPDLLRLHIHPWWLLAHGYGIGSLLTWPMLVFACQAPLGLPVGTMAGALSVFRGERLAAGAEWSPYSQRQTLMAEVHAVRCVARATRRHHEPTNPARTPALGIAYPGGDLYPWLRKRGRSIEVAIPEREQRLAMAVLGIPGSGKTYTLLRRVWIAAQAGMRVIFLDCKGTDPGLAWQVTCAYRLANSGAIVGFWPTQPLDCWRGDGMAIANRLLAVEDWASEGGGLYYRRMATLALQLACTPPSGPPRNSRDFLRRLDIRKLQQLWRGDPTTQADLEQLAADPQVLAGVRGRYSAFFRSLAGTADGCWGLEDVDLAVLTIPTIASRTDADAAVRLVLEDLGHFATRRKARVGDDVLLVLDEFSAVQGGTDQAIHLAERLRDVGVPVVFGAQSPEGLGDERQQWRLLHTVGGGLVLHQTPNPEALVALAGTVRTPEQAWQLDAWGPAGQARVHMADRPRVDPNQVRQLHPGEAFLIQGGRAVKLSVLQAPVPAQVQEEASALRAAALSAAEPVYVAEGIVGTSPQVELWRPSQRALDQPDRAPLLALAAPIEAGQATEPVPALPATPRPRILLALRRAVADRDEGTIAAVVQTGRREQPDWDPTDELQRLRAVGRWRRWRRRPSWRPGAAPAGPHRFFRLPVSSQCGPPRAASSARPNNSAPEAASGGDRPIADFFGPTRA